MRHKLRLLLAVLLAAAMLLQCFPVGAVWMDDPEAGVDPTAPSQPTEPEVPVEPDAPVILQALVRQASSEESTALQSEQTLGYSALVCHFVLDDPMGESGLKPSGVNLDACALAVDGRRIADIMTSESDQSLTASLTLPNGRHVLRVSVSDHDGNKTEAEYVVFVHDDVSDLPVYTVISDLDYAPLGGRITVTIHTANAVNLTALNVSIKADPLCDEDAFEIEAGSGFTLDENSVLYDAASESLQFRVRANVKLSGGRDIVSVSFAVSPDLAKGNRFTYEIPGAWAETLRDDLPNYCEGFSLAARSLPVEAPYTLTVDDLYVGMTDPAYIRVTDHVGGKAYQAQVFESDQGFLGLTNWIGQLAVPGSMLSEPGSYVLYAAGELGRSFPVTVTVAEPAQDLESALTFRAHDNPSGGKTVSWISTLQEQVFLRWAESVSELKNAQPIAVSTTRISLGDVMVQVNTCNISGMKPGASGVLQVSYDGADWSVVKGFSVQDYLQGTRFSLLGSLSEADHSSLEPLIDAASDLHPQLAVQIGDAAADAAWVERLEALEAFGDADLLLIPGADTAGRTAAAVAAQPNEPYSYEYGCIYFAVIPGAYQSADLKWLARDASESHCLWKVLLTPNPVDAADRPALEQAGIHAVFSDGSYSCTPTLVGEQTAESWNESTQTGLRGDGVIYLRCGDASAEPIFVAAEANQNRLAIRAYAMADNGSAEELDSAVLLASSCVTGGHSFAEQSFYDHAADTIVCDRCGLAIPAKDSGYTGFAAMAEGRAYLDRGVVRTGWFSAAGVWMHAGADAEVHQTVDFSTATCTEAGERMAWCTECKISRSYGVEMAASGHHYDSGYHCTNTHFDAAHKTIACGWTGVNLADMSGELEYLYGYYSGAPLTPAVTVTTPDGAELPAGEFTVSYENNTEIGMAAARITGVNSYYGELVLPFEIRPCDVESIRASQIGQSSITLSWDASAGAQRYVVYQQIDSGWKRLGDTAGLSYTVIGLSPAALYTFRIRPYATAAVAGKRLDGSLDRTFWAARHSASLSVRTEGVRFVDVPAEEWFADPVQWAVDQNITNGTDPTHFSPENNCTRGQMVTFLWRAKGCPEPKMRSSPFGDVNDPGEYYYQAVLWAVEQGITRGSSATTFSPDAPVTRGMVVTFLHRAAGTQPPSSAVSPFVDVAADQYYAQSVQWAVEQKITNGVDDSHFSPDTICTRAQIVTFLYRFMQSG